MVPARHAVLVWEAGGPGAAGFLQAFDRDAAQLALPDRVVAVRVRYDALSRADLAQQVASGVRKAARRDRNERRS
ncbi:hypothetical protein [Catellatospora sp. NPDC049609]|uniref:hypothetical protein n=1 Tax=Catellatospora sp. NPDC049609 TaxID=3155505 RepID=UPI0034228FAF